MRRIRSAVLAVTLAAAVTATAGLAHGRAAHQVQYTGNNLPSGALPAPIRWGKPVFVDNFSGTKLNRGRWDVYIDPYGKYSGVRRTASSVQVRNGMLELIGHYERPYGDVSGGIAYRFNRTYGRWAVRFRGDRGAGYEPIVLLWPKGAWPKDGEIDAAEVFNSSRHGAGEFLHLGGLHHFIGHEIPARVDFSKWHVLAVDWLPGHITFWLDGKRQWTVLRHPGSGDYVPSTPFHLALQNDQGCDRHCATNTSTPKYVIMQVDWVRIYKAPAGAT